MGRSSDTVGRHSAQEGGRWTSVDAEEPSAGEPRAEEPKAEEPRAQRVLIECAAPGREARRPRRRQQQRLGGVGVCCSVLGWVGFVLWVWSEGSRRAGRQRMTLRTWRGPFEQ